MEFKATQKFDRTSPRKLRPVVDMAKKLTPSDAVKVLPMVGKRAAEPLVKVIKSALANARMQEANEMDLIFGSIQIGEGPRLKRGRAGSRGRLKPYKRRMSHISVVLTTKDAKVKKVVAETTTEAGKSEVKKEVKTSAKKTTKKESK